MTAATSHRDASYQLPRRDELGFCNILLSALGGDGANMAAKLLFKIGCIEFGLDGGYDARYGSEKKGTATDVSVRFCSRGTPVRQAGPADRPHLLVVFHENLIEPLELHRGLQRGAICIINTRQTPEALRMRLRLPAGKIVGVDATRIAAECRSRLNMPLLALLCHELRFPDELIKDRIARQWPRAAVANLAAFERAVAEATADLFPDDVRSLHPASKATRGPLGWRNMLNGGTIDALTHTTAGRDNRIAAGGRVPRFQPEACNSCGICMTVCSDPGGLLWREGRMVGIDDAFCKGCMRCVEVCPPSKKGHALSVP
ncbi:MAG TPA: 2-oxoacid:acceptor oxidoreductase family protein [Phycisphaerae bacterium]